MFFARAQQWRAAVGVASAACVVRSRCIGGDADDAAAAAVLAAGAGMNVTLGEQRHVPRTHRRTDTHRGGVGVRGPLSDPVGKEAW